MSETTELLETLKRCMKAKSVTYKQVSQKLDLSEGSVKRLFSQKSFSIKRLEEICNLLDMSFFDLAKLTQKKSQSILKFTFLQESTLVNNPKLMIYFYLLLHGRTVGNILKKYQFSKSESDQYLLILDKINLIELHVNNKVKLLVSPNIVWSQGGPLVSHYWEQITKEFLNSTFKDKKQTLKFETAKLSNQSLSILNKKMDGIIKEMHQMAEIDSTLQSNEYQPVGFLVALRPWKFSLIADFERHLNS